MAPQPTEVVWFQLYGCCIFRQTLRTRRHQLEGQRAGRREWPSSSSRLSWLLQSLLWLVSVSRSSSLDMNHSDTCSTALIVFFFLFNVNKKPGLTSKPRITIETSQVSRSVLCVMLQEMLWKGFQQAKDLFALIRHVLPVSSWHLRCPKVDPSFSFSLITASNEKLKESLDNMTSINKNLTGEMTTDCVQFCKKCFNLQVLQG